MDRARRGPRGEARGRIGSDRGARRVDDLPPPRSPSENDNCYSPGPSDGRPARRKRARGASGAMEIRRCDEDGRTLRRSCCFECGNGVARAPSPRFSGGFPSQVKLERSYSQKMQSCDWPKALTRSSSAECFPLPISIVRGLFTFWSLLFSYFTDASRTVRHTIFGVFPAFSPTFLALAFQWLALPPTNRSGLSPSSGRKPCTLVTIGFAPFRIRYSASSWYPYAYAKCIAL